MDTYGQGEIVALPQEYFLLIDVDNQFAPMDEDNFRLITEMGRNIRLGLHTNSTNMKTMRGGNRRSRYALQYVRRTNYGTFLYAFAREGRTIVSRQITLKHDPVGHVTRCQPPKVCQVFLCRRRE